MGQLVLRAGRPSWALPLGHFINAKMPLNIVWPRPDAETNAYERNRKVPSTVPFRMPIAVQGGAWPFKYEIMEGPNWLSIGQTLPADWLTHANGLQDYGILYADNPSTVGSPHTIRIRVTDQQLNTAEVTWTMAVIDLESTADFIWLSGSGSNSNSGSHASPKLDWNGWYLGDKNDSTFQTHQIHHLSGTFLITALPIETVFIAGMANTKPKCFVADLEGTQPVIDLENTAFVEWQSNTNGSMCYSGLKWINPPFGAQSNYRKQFVKGGSNGLRRSLYFENFFDGGGDTESQTGTNSSVVMHSGNDGSHFAHCRNTYHQCHNMDLVLGYNTFDALFEGNFVTGGYGGTYNPSWGYFIKGNDCARHSVRANRAISSGIVRPLVYTSSFVSGFRKYDIEACWNNFKGGATVGRPSGGFPLGQGEDAEDFYGSIWSYRNNWNISHHQWETGDYGPYEFENDSIQHSGVFTDGFDMTQVISPAEIIKTNLQTGTSGMFDGTTNLLTGAARTAGLGTHGCEVA